MWYRYDSLNRLVVSKGLQSNGTIIAGGSGIALTYNAAGQRASAKQGYGALETYTYDQQDRVTSVQIGSLNRVTTSYNLLGQVTGHLERDASGSVVFERHSIQYSDRGQVLSEKGRRKVDRVGTSGSDWQYWHTVNYYSAKGSGGLMPGITSASSSGSSTGAYLFETETKNWLNGSAVPVYGSTSDNDAADTEVRLKYQWVDPTGSDGPREYKREKQSTYGTSSETFFDADGHMTAVSFAHNRNDGTYSGTNFINYETDMSGQITYRYEGGSGSGGSSGSGESGSINERYYRFAGQAMGEIGNNGTANVDYATTIARREESGTGYFRGGDTTGTPNADFDINHVTLASSAGAGSGSGYVAQGGESLQQVARQLWGDSSLWYRLAEANGLSAGTILAAGQNIAVPAGVVSNTHTASSLQPYDPAKAIGDLTPGTLTPNPPAGKKGCGVFGVVLLAVVAVAVTIATKGAAGQFFGKLGLATGKAAGAGVAAGSAAGIAGAATGAALGSIASQGLGVATGIQDRFSWKGVGLAALGGAAGAGLSEFNAFGSATSAATIASDVARGALGSAITQGIGTLTGLQDSFSWAGVAAAGVGGAIGGIAGRALDGRSLFGQTIKEGDFGHTLASATAGGIANAATRSAINGESFGKNLEAAIPDIIGQAVGGAIGSALTKPGGPANLLAGTQYDNVDPAKIGDIVADWSDPVIQQPGAQVNGNVVTAGQGNSTGDTVERIVAAGMARIIPGGPIHPILAAGPVPIVTTAKIPETLEETIQQRDQSVEQAQKYGDHHGHSQAEIDEAIVKIKASYQDHYDRLAGNKIISTPAKPQEWSEDDIIIVTAKKGDAGAPPESVADIAVASVDPTGPGQSHKLVYTPAVDAINWSYDPLRLYEYGGKSYTREGYYQNVPQASSAPSAYQVQQHNYQQRLASFYTSPTPGGLGIGDTLYIAATANGASEQRAQAFRSAGLIADGFAIGRGFAPKTPIPAIQHFQTRPSGFRKDVRQAAWDRALNASPDGIVRDPGTGRPMKQSDPWDMGHIPGHEFRRIRADAAYLGLDRKQFLDLHNNSSLYRPELPTSNQNHKLEDSRKVLLRF